MAKMEKRLDEMFAWNLNAHVMGQLVPTNIAHTTNEGCFVGGYEFLMQNCKKSCYPFGVGQCQRRLLDEIGDKICIFGFSRGAYTARALAGMVHKAGSIPLILPRSPLIYRLSTRLALSRPATISKSPSHTRCSHVRTSSDGSNPRRSRRPSLSMSTSSSSVCGIQCRLSA